MIQIGDKVTPAKKYCDECRGDIPTSCACGTWIEVWEGRIGTYVATNIVHWESQQIGNRVCNHACDAKSRGTAWLPTHLERAVDPVNECAECSQDCPDNDYLCSSCRKNALLPGLV